MNIERPRKTKLVVVRVTPVEMETMKENAKKRGMKLSRYVRYRTLFDKF